MTVSSDSACNKPADSSVRWSSSTNNPSARTFTLRILCSIGSSHCFFFWSIAFNSSMVFVGTTWTVRSTPSKVFTFSSRNMAAAASSGFVFGGWSCFRNCCWYCWRGCQWLFMPSRIWTWHQLVKCGRLSAFWFPPLTYEKADSGAIGEWFFLMFLFVVGWKRIPTL